MVWPHSSSQPPVSHSGTMMQWTTVSVQMGTVLRIKLQGQNVLAVGAILQARKKIDFRFSFWMGEGFRAGEIGETLMAKKNKFRMKAYSVIASLCP